MAWRSRCCCSASCVHHGVSQNGLPITSALRAGLLQRRAVDVDQGAVRLQQADQAAGGVDDGPVALLALQHDVLRAAAAGRLALQRLAERHGGKLLLALGDHQQDHADRQVDDRPEDVGARVGGGCGQLGKDEDIAAIEGEEKAAQAVADPGVLAPAQEQRQADHEEDRAADQIGNHEGHDPQRGQDRHAAHSRRGRKPGLPRRRERLADEHPRAHPEQDHRRRAKDGLAVDRPGVTLEADEAEGHAAGAGGIGHRPEAEGAFAPLEPPQVKEDAGQHEVADDGIDDGRLDRDAEHESQDRGLLECLS